MPGAQRQRALALRQFARALQDLGCIDGLESGGHSCLRLRSSDRADRDIQQPATLFERQRVVKPCGWIAMPPRAAAIASADAFVLHAGAPHSVG